MPVTTRSKIGRRRGAAAQRKTASMSSKKTSHSHRSMSHDAASQSKGAQSHDYSAVAAGDVRVLTNPQVLEYADELLQAAEHSLLYDLARHVHAKAHERCPAARQHGELPKPRSDMSTDRLYQVILQLVRCGAEQADRDGHKRTYEHTMKNLAARGEHMANKHHVRLTDPVKMARQIIRATRYETEPTHPETISCKQKGISFTMDAGDDNTGVVHVTRTRAGGQTYKYTYATPTQRDVDHLVNVTAKMRDHVLRHGRF